MDAGRQTTVLFADVAGSTKLYETAGDVIALEAIGRCIDTLRKAEEDALGELVWRTDDDMTTFRGGRPPARTGAAPLRLKYRDKELTRRRDNDSVVIGREQGCGLTVADHMASRQHCTVERRQD